MTTKRDPLVTDAEHAQQRADAQMMRSAEPPVDTAASSDAEHEPVAESDDRAAQRSTARRKAHK